ncbi:hypothetical protein AMTR_s00071p00154870, partial [Amborella trichopoda]
VLTNNRPPPASGVSSSLPRDRIPPLSGSSPFLPCIISCPHVSATQLQVKFSSCLVVSFSTARMREAVNGGPNVFGESLLSLAVVSEMLPPVFFPSCSLLLSFPSPEFAANALSSPPSDSFRGGFLFTT